MATLNLRGLLVLCGVTVFAIRATSASFEILAMNEASSGNPEVWARRGGALLQLGFVLDLLSLVALVAVTIAVAKSAVLKSSRQLLGFLLVLAGSIPTFTLRPIMQALFPGAYFEIDPTRGVRVIEPIQNGSIYIGTAALPPHLMPIIALLLAFIVGSIVLTKSLKDARASGS